MGMASRTAAAPDDSWCSVILVSLVVAIPLAILPGSFAARDTTPRLAILFLSSALLAWLARRWWPGVVGLWRTPVGRLFYSLLIFAAASILISSVFSRDPTLSVAGTVWRRLGAMSQAAILFLASALAAVVFADRSVARRVMLGMEAAGAIASVYAILQYAGWDPLIPASLYTVGSMPAVLRPPATLGHATYFATFLLPVILIAVSFRLRERAFRRQRMHEIIFFLAISALILSGTRSALLGLGVGVCTLFLLDKRRLLQRRILARFAYRALAFAGVAAAFLLLPTGAGVRVRLAQWATDRGGGPRLMVWRDSLALIRQHAAWGIGPEMFEAEFRRAESLELARAFPDHYHESPHNFFLEAGLSQGVFGLAVWLALLGLGCWCGVAVRKSGDSAPAPLLPAMLGMLVSLQFCPLTITNELYLLAIVAMLAGLAARSMEREFCPMPMPPVVTPFAFVAGVALLAVGATYAAQDVLYILAERRIAHGDVAGAEHWYGSARKIPIPGPDLEVSRQFAALARSSPFLRDDALAAARHAAATAEGSSAEQFSALYQSAMLAILSGDLPRAEAKLRASIDAAPTWYRPRVGLASVLWASGRNEEAEREAVLALKCAGRIEPEVKRTLDQARAQATAMISSP
jgi:O-antigen ligase